MTIGLHSLLSSNFFLDQTLHLAYVGTLADGYQVNLSTGGKSLKEFAENLKQEHLDALLRKAKPVFHKIGIPFKGKNEQCYIYGGCCLTRDDPGEGKFVFPAFSQNARKRPCRPT